MRERQIRELLKRLVERRGEYSSGGRAGHAEGLHFAVLEVQKLITGNTRKQIDRARRRLDRLTEKLNQGEKT